MVLAYTVNNMADIRVYMEARNIAGKNWAILRNLKYVFLSILFLFIKYRKVVIFVSI